MNLIRLLRMLRGSYQDFPKPRYVIRVHVIPSRVLPFQTPVDLANFPRLKSQIRHYLMLSRYHNPVLPVHPIIRRVDRINIRKLSHPPPSPVRVLPVLLRRGARPRPVAGVRLLLPPRASVLRPRHRAHDLEPDREHLVPVVGVAVVPVRVLRRTLLWRSLDR